MQKDELWKYLTDRNPRFLTGPSTLTPKGLRHLFDVAYDKGHEQGVANGRVLGERDAAKNNPLAHLFDFTK